MEESSLHDRKPLEEDATDDVETRTSHQTQRAKAFNLVTNSAFNILREPSFKFDSCVENTSSITDGARMAELFANRLAIVPGMTRWVHMSEPDYRFDDLDPRRNWTKGTVVEVSDMEFAVEVPSAHTTHRFPLLSPGQSAGELLAMARRDLRGIPWKNLSEELLKDQRSAPVSNLNTLAEPMNGRSPDFFMTHSWLDNAEAKYAELQHVTEEFRSMHGRDPIFWLDKVCIDQKRISEGLRVLPVNVMACMKILVLCGDTYMSRLWCVLELCTLLSLMTEGEAAERVEFSVLPGSSTSEKKVLDSLLSFDVTKAQCYDPNEKEHLFNVIGALGFDNINGKMQRLGLALKKKGLAKGPVQWGLRTR